MERHAIVSGGVDLSCLVPSPIEWSSSTNWYELPERVRVWSEHPDAFELVRSLLGAATGRSFELVASPSAAQIEIHRISHSNIAPEGYELDVSGDRISIRAAEYRGVAWAVETLRQLLPAEIYSAAFVSDVLWRVPVCRVADAPRFGWRGILLDVARWYQPVEFIYRFVDLAAIHKLNVLHLHLTDDQGWRFEVKKHPKLTSVGAWRAESRVGHWRDGDTDGIPHGGYYTQDELRSLSQYAESRGVTIVPEIDIPGHTQAAIAAYPELGNDPSAQLEVETGWGVIKHVINFEEATIRFFYDVFDELMDVFPGLYIHIGGDECPRDEWSASSRTAGLLLERGLSSVEEIEPWILDRVSTYLRSRGRIPIGWDEILDGAGPRDTTAVMSWRGESGGLEALRQGRDVVLAPNTHLYFDQYQSPDIASEPIAADGVITLENVFSYRPADGIDLTDAGTLLGVECALWCEHLSKPSNIEYMMFPRVAAYSDIAWGRRHEDTFARYRRILARHEDRLARLGVRRRLSEAAETSASVGPSPAH